MLKFFNAPSFRAPQELFRRGCCSPVGTHGETEAQRGAIACPRPHSQGSVLSTTTQARCPTFPPQVTCQSLEPTGKGPRGERVPS